MTAVTRSRLALATGAVAAALLFAAPVEGGRSNNVDKNATQALELLGAGTNTIAGPATLTRDDGGRGRIYQVISGEAPDVCITVQNLGGNDVSIQVPDEPSGGKIESGSTAARCYAAPTEITLRCSRTSRCSVVWRIDRL
jgi:hypothetical protein